MTSADFLVIGGGMAGASVACELAAQATVILVEREEHPGFHSTGRSAAVFSETYGNETIRAMTKSGRAFLENPPPEFGDAPLLSARGRLYIAREDQLDALERHRALDRTMESLTPEEVRRLVPALREGHVAAGLFDASTLDMDVHALHQGYLRLGRARGMRISTRTAVQRLDRAGGVWRAETNAGAFEARVVVNAAGAWADGIGALAGARSIGLRPLRRTAMLIDPPSGMPVAPWPLVTDVDEEFYFKPDAGRILLSPADETESVACDIQPDELDLAIAVDRLQRAAEIPVRRIWKSWAGLRSFVADRTPAVGFDGQAPSFFWLAGQGGYGIQTAPAMARLAAALATGGGIPSDIAARGVAAAHLSPARPALVSFEPDRKIRP